MRHSLTLLAAVCLAAALSLGCAKRSTPRVPPAASPTPAGQPSSSAVTGTEPPAPSVSRQRAIEILTNTDEFASTAVGEGGSPSEEAVAFAKLFNEPDADAIFKQLLQQSKVVGHLYAMCGLYFTDQSTFQQGLANLAATKDEVMTYWGCIKSPLGVPQILKSSSPGVVRLQNSADTVDAWVERNRDLADQSFEMDMVGGGYPDLFRQFALKTKH